MATLTHAHEERHDVLGTKRLGIWMFFLSETFLFGAMISTRFYLQSMDRPDDLNQVLGLSITAVLLLSSFTAYRAETASTTGNHSGFVWYMTATILLGVLFLAGVGIEWYEAYLHFPPSTGFGTVFFATTGIHATHVLTDVVILGILLYQGRKKGTYGPGNYWGVEGSIKYWHFVDVAWVFIYPTLYLV